MDKEFFEECVCRYENTVFRIAVSYCKSYHDAQDITQEVFLRFYKSGKRLGDCEQAKYLLIRIAVNISINHQKSIWKTRVLRTDSEQLLGRLYSQQSDDDMRCGKVLCAVRELPAKYRSVVYLYYFEDMKISEISRTLGVKETTVQTQLMRARALLKGILEEEEHE